MPIAHMNQKQFYWQHETAVEFDQAPPVQNTWYTVLDTTADVRLIFTSISQSNDEVAGKNLQMRWTIDGLTCELAATAVASGTLYYVRKDQYTQALKAQTTIINSGQYVDIRALSIKIEARTTSVPGTNQRLRAWIVYETHQET